MISFFVRVALYDSSIKFICILNFQYVERKTLAWVAKISQLRILKKLSEKLLSPKYLHRKKDYIIEKYMVLKSSSSFILSKMSEYHICIACSKMVSIPKFVVILYLKLHVTVISCYVIIPLSFSSLFCGVK